MTPEVPHSQQPHSPDRPLQSSTYDRRKFLKLAGLASAGWSIGFGEFLLSRQPASATLKLAQTEPIKVGILHSLSGTMAIAEKSAVDANLMAITEINQAGGVLGRPIEAIVEDAQSDWPTFQEKAEKLIDQDQVVTIFGCWTSASRKSVLPTLERRDHLLWYPITYEGQECSKNIFYTGGVPNQQIEPAVDWILQQFPGKPIFLVGSDYVYPRTINTIIKTQLRLRRAKLLGETYLPLGVMEVKNLIDQIQTAMPRGGVLLNSLNGDSNIAFFQQLRQAGLTAKTYPTFSLLLGEEEIQAIAPALLQGHYAVQNYFQTVNTAANRKFVRAFKARYGANRLVNDPIAAAYTAVYLWKQAVEKAGTASDLNQVRKAAMGLTWNAPEGKVTLTQNHHLTRFARIGRVRPDGLLDIVFQSAAPIAPQPWSQRIEYTQGLACDWSNPNRGGKYRISPSRIRN